jgi:predicted Fe-Mo cluster-binding NifX family protein
MKIAISSQGKDLTSGIDPRFGRAAGFIIYDLDSDEYHYLSNSLNLHASQGAGIQTAQNVAGAGVQAVLSGNVGPKAFTALQAGGIATYLIDNSATVQEAVQAFRDGKLSPANEANKPGHW